MDIWVVDSKESSVWVTENTGFPGGSDSKESACKAGDMDSIPGEGNGLPTPVFLPEEFHGQRSLGGYSPFGRKESDMTEQLTRFR